MTLASCYFRTVDGETRVGIFALRDIKIGEELTYDYKYVHPFLTDPIFAILLAFDKVVSPIWIFSLVYVELPAVFDVLV